MTRKKRINILKQLATLPEATSDSDITVIVDLISRMNGNRYNLNKLSEELNELAGACLKVNNKKTKNRPLLANLIEEIGDVYFRLLAVELSSNISHSEIESRIFNKANKLLEYARGGKYTRL